MNMIKTALVVFGVIVGTGIVLDFAGQGKLGTIAKAIAGSSTRGYGQGA